LSVNHNNSTLPINSWYAQIVDRISYFIKMLFLLHVSVILSNTVTARSQAWTVFARSNVGIVGSNPIPGMYVGLRLFCVYVVALRLADPPSK
jgi:hypothetical protein